MKQLLISFFLLAQSLFIFAQDSTSVMQDSAAVGLRAEGKI